MPKTSAGQAKSARLTLKGISSTRGVLPSIDPHGEEVEDEEAGEDGSEETHMLEMITMLQDFQKRKAKTTSRSSAYVAKKNALYDQARKNASTAVREGVAYIEQYKAVISNLKAQEIAQDRLLEGSALLTGQEEAVHAILAEFPPVFQEISHRRAETINDTSAMLEAHSVERHNSRRRLIKNARARIEEDYENQRIATDASALIKHYKALLMA